MYCACMLHEYTGPCENGKVRLVNGLTSSRGVVEVCVNGRFAIVCADHWDNMDASVVCREQGYSPYGKPNNIKFYYHTECSRY